MNIITNPLDITNSFLRDATHLTYHFVCVHLEKMYKKHDDFIPSSFLITKHFPEHFVQELSLSIMERGCYELVGAFDKDDFIYKIQNKEYHQFIPDEREVQHYLNEMNLSYVDIVGETEVVRNNAICEVW